MRLAAELRPDLLGSLHRSPDLLTAVTGGKDEGGSKMGSWGRRWAGGEGGKRGNGERGGK